jgi:hypothetical protein
VQKKMSAVPLADRRRGECGPAEQQSFFFFGVCVSQPLPTQRTKKEKKQNGIIFEYQARRGDRKFKLRRIRIPRSNQRRQHDS